MTDRRDPFGPVDPDGHADPDERPNPFDPRRPDAIAPRRPDADDAPLPGSIAPPGMSAGPPGPPSRRRGDGARPESIPPRSLTPAGRLDPRAPRPQDARRRPAPQAADPPNLVKRLQEAGTGDRLKALGGPAGFAALLIWKVGRIALVALGKVALLFKIPLLGTVISGAISIGAYAVFFGWSFAIGLVGSIFVHELGHVVQIRREGKPVRALNFVPFLGAYVLSDASRTVDEQARISIAGPMAGAGLAAIVLVIANGDPLLEAIAFTGFYLNLLNLLPVPMLDGAGVGGMFTAGWWVAIAAALGLTALLSGTGFAAIAALAAAIMAWSRRDHGFDLDPGDGIAVRARATMAALYVGVIVLCAFGMASAFRDRTDELVDQYGSRELPAAVVAAR